MCIFTRGTLLDELKWFPAFHGGNQCTFIAEWFLPVFNQATVSRTILRTARHFYLILPFDRIIRFDETDRRLYVIHNNNIVFLQVHQFVFQPVGSEQEEQDHYQEKQQYACNDQQDLKSVFDKQIALHIDQRGIGRQTVSFYIELS